jgi:hypothetical protein
VTVVQWILWFTAIVDLRQWKMRSSWSLSSRCGLERKAVKRAVQQTEIEMKIHHGKKRYSIKRLKHNYIEKWI